MLRTKRKQRSRPMSEINVVPYIDVMLVLLVIFMITAPMLTQGITVDLPKTTSTETIKTTEREPIIVSVNQVGEYFLNIHEQPDTPLSPELLMTRVAAELLLAKEAKQVLPVLVKGDGGVAYAKVVAAMGFLKEAGAIQVGLLTDSSSKQESRA